MNELQEKSSGYLAYLERRNSMLDALNAETSAYIHRLSAWMIAQLFVANAGGLTVGAEGSPAVAQVCFVAGIIAAMSCSLSAWWQAHLVYHENFRLGDPNAYFGRDHLPTNDDEYDKKQKFWFGSAIAFGVGSVLCFAAGALLRIFG